MPRCRNSLSPLFLFHLLALDGQRIALGFDGKVALGEAGHRHGDAVGISAGALDVVGRIALRIVGRAKAVQHGEQAVEADGGTVER
jgi:hypothetical protein